MMTERVLLCLFLIAVSPLRAEPNQNAEPKVIKLAQLNAFLKSSQSDSLLLTQRLAAIYFHQTLNQYRISIHADTLVWDEALWLCAQNHCNWMALHNKLSHTQQENTVLYSGKTPAQRVQFVTGENLGGCAENALYSSISGKFSVNELAGYIAAIAFELWKGSAGHHQNMTGPYGTHGVAFVLSDGLVWGTDVFTFRQEAYCPRTQPQFAGHLQETRVQRKNASPERALLSLMNKTYPQRADGWVSRAIKESATAHAKYLLRNGGGLSHEERGNPEFYARTPYLRMLKASAGLLFFRHAPKERYLMREFLLDELKAEEAMAGLKAEIDGIADGSDRMVFFVKQRKKEKLKFVVVIAETGRRKSN